MREDGDRLPVMVLLGGGVGPMAGIALHKKILEKTVAPGGDSDHLPVMHLSFSSLIPDRTRFLLDGTGENPGTVMADHANRAIGAMGPLFDTVRIGVPCNTFHADLIFNAFRSGLSSGGSPGTRIDVVHMLDTAAADLSRRYRPGSVMGLLSTTGTRRSGVWRDRLEKEGFGVLETGVDEQNLVHELIYSTAWGLKSVFPPSNEARSRLLELLRQLADRGADAVILGCTELPLASPDGWDGPELVDPVDKLAEALAMPLFSGGPP